MNVLRLAIALSDVESKKFNKILSSIIIGLLKSNNPNQKYSSADIQRLILSTYGLEFSTSEIETAIDDDSAYFETYKENNIRFCSLSSKAISKPSSNDQNSSFNIDKCIDAFFEEHKESLSNIGKFDKLFIKSTVNKYIYNSFNNDKEELAYLMSGKLKTTQQNSNKRYSPKEVKLIKLFLDWNNEEKNKFVFDVVRAAYNYCILTIKENAEDSMFSYKKLYLDTNVIFSLAGINGKDRMYSTQAFIKKSKELHSNIYYTSCTADECRATLKGLVEKMAAIVKKDSFLSCEELKDVFPSSNPAALFELYIEWARVKPSRNGDYNGFLIHMIDVLNETLDDISLEPIENSFLEKNEETIERNRISLAEFKDKLGRKHSEAATRTDACNYCYVDSLRNKKTSTIKNQDIFFISSDTGLCKWSEGRCSGYINIFILPSVMYSMMLRFSNRTKDDYKSFNDFVLLSFSSEHLTEDEQKAKEDLVCAINELEIPDDAKKKVLYFANRELEKQTRKKTEFTEQTVAKAIDVGLDNFFEEFESEKDKEKEDAVAKTSVEKYKEGYNSAIENIAMNNTNKRIKMIKRIGWAISFFLMLVTILLTVFCLIVFIKEQDIKSISGWILACFSLISFVCLCFTGIKNIKKNLFHINSEKIYKKELTKQKDLAKANGKVSA